LIPVANDHRPWLGAAVLALSTLPLSAQQSSSWRDPSTHKIQFVSVDQNVRLEVLDWGGSGRPIVLLTGLGGTAHMFDEFAPKLAKESHVYGITRRGFGASSMPTSGYEADRLGDDVLAVLDFLKLSSPVLVGSSAGGIELSSIASRFPHRVGGLVYLDAAYPYAFDNGRGLSLEEFFELLQKVPQPPPAGVPDMASFGAYQAWLKRIAGVTVPEAELRQTMDPGPDGSVGKQRTPPRVQEAVFAGMKKYTNIRAPVLAIYAVPPHPGTWLEDTKDPALRAAAEVFNTQALASILKQATAFEEGVPNARVIRLQRANHVIFLSNEVDVLREMRAFLKTLQ
jgi:pimeloyl-ACP methyl ester carboxylesterase